ncbi:M56 family metallopeptidase [Nocardia fluminea]|uniref:Peptidase M48-like protein n=1 Tax=Nocardia fluminea TaxID=134984 RepID=A0A2N3V4V6_9NOCA|nr:M56 family metallopeptidase [Nocardia fluminea]PKV76658.1 peptidase M48-like protein [Nocardia fluminea]
MIIALSTAWAAALLCVAAPGVLRRITPTMTPRAAVASWLICLFSVVTLAGAAVAAAVWPGHAPGVAVAEAATQCLTRVVHSVPTWLADPLTGAVVIVVVGLGIRVTASARRHARAGARVRAYHRDVVSVVARRGGEEVPVMWLDHPKPMAYSVDGRPGMVVATEGLAKTLNDGERRAVLAHEYAHLRGGHHRLIRSCEVLAAALPWIPLFARAPKAVAALAEFAADDSAAIATSPETIRSALCIVAASTSTQPSATLSLGGQVLQQRLHRLNGSKPARRSSRWMAAGLSPIVAATAAPAGMLVCATIACLIMP